MKKLFLFMIAAAVAAMTVSACGAAMTTADRAAIEQMVQDNLSNRDYTVLIQLMIPSVGPTRAVSNYSIKVSGDTLVSYLPFIGRAYNLPYGGGKGLDFTAKINEYHDIVNSGGGHDIVINVANDEDVFFYTLNVSASGSAFLSVSSRNRERISYTGEMYLP